MSVIRAHAEDETTEPQYVFTITDGGFAKRTAIGEYRVQSRGGLGIKTMKQDDDRGNLVGGFIVVDGDEVLCVKQSGQVTRSAIDDHLRPTSRDTKGVKFVGVSDGDAVAQVARSVESRLEHNLEALTPEAAAAVEAAGGATIEPVDDADTEEA
jgi:DNA gyrase subunit A